MREKRLPYLLIAPALIGAAIIIFYPMIKGVMMAFQHYNFLKPGLLGQYNGVNNFIKVFNDPKFWIAFKYTFHYVIGSVGGEFILGFIMALLLNRNFRGRALIRGIVLIPWVTPGVLAALMWKWLYNGNYGLINWLLSDFGFIKEFIPFLSKPLTAMPCVILTTIWKGTPFVGIMLLAGLQAIPKQLYEAADIDGANWWQKFFNITLPSLAPVVITTLILRTIWTTNAVELIYVMTEGGPGTSTLTLPVYVYKTIKGSLNYAYGATISVILMIVLIVSIFFYLKQVRKTGVNI